MRRGENGQIRRDGLMLSEEAGDADGEYLSGMCSDQEVHCSGAGRSSVPLQRGQHCTLSDEKAGSQVDESWEQQRLGG